MVPALRKCAVVLAAVLLVMFPALPTSFSQSKASAAAGPQLGLTSALGVPASADIDVSDQLNAILAGLATPATVVLEGMYRIDHSVKIAGETNLRIVGGPGTGFIRYTQGVKPAGWPAKEPFYPYVVVKDSAQISLEGFTIQGPLTAPVYNSALEFAAGVLVEGPASYILVSGLTIRGVHGDFVMVNEGSRMLPANVTFQSIRGEIAGRQAAGVVGVNGLLLKSVTFLKSARSGIDIEPASPLGARNIAVEDSLIQDYANFCIGAHANVFNVAVRRTSCVGGRGFGKFGPTAGEVGPNNAGLVLDDVRYDFRGTLPLIASPMLISVQRTSGIAVSRMNALYRGGGGTIDGAGFVRDSVFVSNSGSRGIVCLGAAVEDLGNTGTGHGACSDGGSKH